MVFFCLASSALTCAARSTACDQAARTWFRKAQSKLESCAFESSEDVPATVCLTCFIPAQDSGALSASGLPSTGEALVTRVSRSLNSERREEYLALRPTMSFWSARISLPSSLVAEPGAPP